MDETDSPKYNSIIGSSLIKRKAYLGATNVPESPMVSPLNNSFTGYDKYDYFEKGSGEDGNFG